MKDRLMDIVQVPLLDDCEEKNNHVIIDQSRLAELIKGKFNNWLSDRNLQ